MSIDIASLPTGVAKPLRVSKPRTRRSGPGTVLVKDRTSEPAESTLRLYLNEIGVVSDNKAFYEHKAWSALEEIR